MIRHFCNGCGEETKLDDLKPITTGCGSEAAVQAGLDGAFQIRADLCQPCVDWLTGFLSTSDHEHGHRSAVGAP